MSALAMIKKRRMDPEILGPCDNRCKAHLSAAVVRKDASMRVYIMGRPAGVVCEPCAKEMQAAWDSAVEAA